MTPVVTNVLLGVAAVTLLVGVFLYFKNNANLTDPTKWPTKADLERANRMRNTGIAMIVAGIVLAVIGFVMHSRAPRY